MAVSCPHCAKPVDQQARTCPHCGVALAIAAILAENRVLTQELLPSGVPITPEVLVPRLGDHLVEMGIIGPVELDKALRYQELQSNEGRSLLLGQALKELGLVDSETLEQAITVQILQLQTALRKANESLEQRVLERTLELQRAVDKLTELSQIKNNFVANISHELRTPLTHIKGYLDILSDDGLGPLTPHQSQAVAVLRRSEARLERLIEDLIQFSLASKGELSLTLSCVNLADLFQATVGQQMPKAREAEVLVEVSLPEGLPLVHCDEEKIFWVICHLLDNAIKFTPEGGQVKLEAYALEGQVTIAVTDTGIGIPEQRLSEIFEAFHQLDGSSTRRYAGTGLGLALTRQIIDAHGSQIRVDSVLGKGSRFAFTLPTVSEKLPQVSF